jgi:hypothetical protein
VIFVKIFVVFVLKACPSYSPINVIGISGRKKNKSTAAHKPLLYNKAG